MPPEASPAEVDAGWAVAGFVFDNERNQIAAYLNCVSSEFWSDADQFYRSAATAWKQAQLAKTPGQAAAVLKLSELTAPSPNQPAGR